MPDGAVERQEDLGTRPLRCYADADALPHGAGRIGEGSLPHDRARRLRSADDVVGYLELRLDSSRLPIQASLARMGPQHPAVGNLYAIELEPVPLQPSIRVGHEGPDVLGRSGQEPAIARAAILDCGAILRWTQR